MPHGWRWSRGVLLERDAACYTGFTGEIALVRTSESLFSRSVDAFRRPICAYRESPGLHRWLSGLGGPALELRRSLVGGFHVVKVVAPCARVVDRACGVEEAGRRHESPELRPQQLNFRRMEKAFRVVCGHLESRQADAVRARCGRDVGASGTLFTRWGRRPRFS